MPDAEVVRIMSEVLSELQLGKFVIKVAPVQISRSVAPPGG